MIGHEKGPYQIFLASAEDLTDPLLVVTVAPAVGFPAILIMHRKLEVIEAAVGPHMSKPRPKFAILETGSARVL